MVVPLDFQFTVINHKDNELIKKKKKGGDGVLLFD